MQELFLNSLSLLPFVVFFSIVYMVIKAFDPANAKVKAKEDPVIEWFKKIALLIDMGDLKIEKLKNDPHGMVVISDGGGSVLLNLFKSPNWEKTPEKYISMLGKLEAELKIILDGEHLRTKHTQPIHKFLATQSAGIVDEMLNKAIQNHGV